MKWPFFSRQKSADNSAQIERYKDLRKAQRALNVALVKQLPKAAVPECGKKLGLVKAGTLILNNDDEIAILYDYCFHHYRRDGKNPIERHCLNSPPAPGSVEAELLQAMQEAYYSLFKVIAILPQTGARLLDLAGGEEIELVDIGLSETGEAGTVLAGRILPCAGLNMSSGTMIPLPEAVYEEKLKPVIRKFLKEEQGAGRPRFSPGQAATFAAEAIRVALHAGGEDNVFYTDIER